MDASGKSRWKLILDRGAPGSGLQAQRDRWRVFNDGAPAALQLLLPIHTAPAPSSVQLSSTSPAGRPQCDNSSFQCTCSITITAFCLTLRFYRHSVKFHNYSSGYGFTVFSILLNRLLTAVAKTEDASPPLRYKCKSEKGCWTMLKLSTTSLGGG